MIKFNVDNIYKKWTRQAIDCFRRNCRCEGCILNTLESKCEMKKTVIELVKRYGIPNDELLLGLTPRQKEIINAILNGCNTKHEIMKYTGLKDFQVQITIGKLCIYAMEHGYEFISTVNRLPELVEYFRELTEKGKEQ